MDKKFSVENSQTKTLEREYNKLNICYKIYLWWKFDGKYMHLKFKRGIRNLFRWFPVIWKDRDYDDHYIWEILKTKIKFQGEYIGKRDFHENAKRDSEIMLLCANLIEKVQTEYYQSEYMDYHESKLYFVPIDNSDLEDLDDDIKKEMSGSTTLHFDEIWENFDEFFAKYPHAYREVTKTDTYILTNDSKEKIAMNMGYYLHRKANRILFTLLERNITNWWY
jgi:hypothetical protein